MAKAKVSIGKKLKNSVAKHKGDETSYGIIDLPGGISNGIARLNECKFDTYKRGDNQGEYYFLANGIIVSPDANDQGVPVKGLRTQIIIPVCDTTKSDGETVSQDEHVASILNEIRKLGVDTKDIDDDSLEDVVEELKEVAPYFRFSTTQSQPTKQYPNPRVWENWHGSKGLEDYVADEEEEVEEDEEEEEEEKPVVRKKTAKKKTVKKKVTKKSLSDLAEEADGGDEDAEIELTKAAEEADVDPEEYDTWAEVVAAIEGDEEPDEEEDETEYEDVEDDEDEETDEEEQEEVTPEKEEVYYYKPPKKRKKVEVEVTAVFKGKKTCNLKDLENDGQIYKGVQWEALDHSA